MPRHASGRHVVPADRCGLSHCVGVTCHTVHDGVTCHTVHDGVTCRTVHDGVTCHTVTVRAAAMID